MTATQKELRAAAEAAVLVAWRAAPGCRASQTAAQRIVDRLYPEPPQLRVIELEAGDEAWHRCRNGVVEVAYGFETAGEIDEDAWEAAFEYAPDFLAAINDLVANPMKVSE